MWQNSRRKRRNGDQGFTSTLMDCATNTKYIYIIYDELKFLAVSVGPDLCRSLCQPVVKTSNDHLLVWFVMMDWLGTGACCRWRVNR